MLAPVSCVLAPVSCVLAPALSSSASTISQKASIYFIYTSIASASSLVSRYSSALCERFESPGPIFIASQPIRIQSEVVGEEKVSRPVASAALRRGEPGRVAEERLCRFRACNSLLHSACNSSNISSQLYCSVGRMSTTKVQRSGMTLWALPAAICVTLSLTSPISGEMRVKRCARSFAMSSIAAYNAFTPSPVAACALTP